MSAVCDYTAKHRRDKIKRMEEELLMSSVTGAHFCWANRKYYSEVQDPSLECDVPNHVYISPTSLEPGTYLITQHISDAKKPSLFCGNQFVDRAFLFSSPHHLANNYIADILHCRYCPCHRAA